MSAKTIAFADVKTDLLQDPAVRQAYEELAPVYQVARLRIERGLTQKELAEAVGTKQPSIARLENGKSSPSLPFLQRVVTALGARLIVRIEPQPEGILLNRAGAG